MILIGRGWQEGKVAPHGKHTWTAARWVGCVQGRKYHEILGIHHVRDDLGGPIGWNL
jgi:hypothetical protein